MSNNGNWISSAIRHPGALRAKLGIKEGKTIPHAMLDKAEHSKNPKTRKQAQLAETLSKFHK